MPGARGNGDGRVQRGRRNREAVVEALLGLVAAGDLRPTARAIADRAGISRRSVFQHFDDVESIYRAASERVGTALGPLLLPVTVEGPAEARLAELVERRRALFAALDPIARAARVREPFSEELLLSRRRLSARMREQCRGAFAPEIEGRTDAEEVASALAGALSWSLWDHLRSDLRLGDDEALAVMARLAGAVLPAAPAPPDPSPRAAREMAVSSRAEGVAELAVPVPRP